MYMAHITWLHDVIKSMLHELYLLFQGFIEAYLMMATYLNIRLFFGNIWKSGQAVCGWMCGFDLKVGELEWVSEYASK